MAAEPTPSHVWGRRTWTAIGVVLLAVGVVYVASQVSGILTPVVLALFPAALLDPLAGRLRRTRVPNAIVALVMIVALLGIVAGAVAFITAALIDQMPQIVDSVVSGVAELEQAVDWQSLPGDAESLSDLAAQAGDAVMGGGMLSQGVGAVGGFVTGAVLLVVVLFFYRKDGRQV